jgi:pyruvate formate lyase activating enzyme
MHEAMFWKSAVNKSVQCELCARNCLIAEGKKGVCRARKNIDGKLYSLTYGKLCSMAVDPIEKKPFYHFHPGSKVFSIATFGCNLACDHCQNAEISQADPEKEIVNEILPEKVVEMTLENKCAGIAYTYTEPTVFYEYAFETAKIAKEKGLYSCFVSNGIINREPLKKISPYLDAMNLDLKGFTDEFYKKYCHFPGGLEQIKQTARNCLEFGIHLEVTTLLIPGHNDSEEEIRKIAEFVKSLREDVPLHFSRFHPEYKMLDVEPTPIETVMRAKEIGEDVGLKNVHTGNI